MCVRKCAQFWFCLFDYKRYDVMLFVVYDFLYYEKIMYECIWSMPVYTLFVNS